MSNYSFDFSFVKGGAPIVTLSSIGLAFNSGARSMLGYPQKVDIGFDEKMNVIGIRKHSEYSNVQATYDFESRAKDNWVRISMRDFMKYLSQKTEIDFITKAIQFLPSIDDETGMLIVTVDQEHIKP